MSETPNPTQPSDHAALARWLLVIGVTFTVLLVGFLWIARSLTVGNSRGGGDTAAAGGPEVEYPAPDFRLASLDGSTIGPPDFEGHAVIVDFWATWCGPCKIQAQMLERMHKTAEADGKKVRFLAINVGEDRETVQRYVEKMPFPYSVLLDSKEEVSARYQVVGLPTVMVIDTKGRISFMRTGLTDIPTLRRELAKVGINV